MMKTILAMFLAASLSGCVRNLQDCPQPDYARFARDMDRIQTLREADGIDEEMATRLYALQAMTLRTEMVVMREHCR